ncbi:hypothetical protein ATCC90586_000542 [Pythium insidiosum]|nr:hypothetical protein ATCC90586_000542 [Pythium insidiosum]
MGRLTARKKAVRKAPRLRSALLWSAKGYEPCTVLEVQLRAGIGAILCKPQWWNKWRRVAPTKRKAKDAAAAAAAAPTIREKWMTELTDRITERTLYWHTKFWWPLASGSDHRARQGGPTTFNYSLVWQRDAASAESTETFLKNNKRFENFSMVAWYCHLYLLKRAPTGGFGSAMYSEDREAETLAMTTQIIKSACTNELTKSNFHEQYPGADVRPHVLDALWFHIYCARKRLQRARACAEQTLETLIAQYYLDDATCTEPFISPGPANETWIADGLIPATLKRSFVEQVAVLAAVPEAEKDWHPGSNQQVLDLVHPSLYCCVFGETLRVRGALASTGSSTIVDRMTTTLFDATEIIAKPDSGVDRYQWIPSEFHVDDDGAVEIRSYINNLHPETHSALYTSIAAVFQELVPMFDRVLTSLANPPPRPVLSTHNIRRQELDKVPWLPEIPEELDLEPELPTTYTIKGRTVQVITKIAEIHLTPANPKYPGGAWHIEGTETEGIVATGIYYFGCENISESLLSFQVLAAHPHVGDEDHLGVAAVYGFEEEQSISQFRGSASVLEDRCIVFPNTLQHKVEPFELADPTRPGVRKILAFFLVDPGRPIPSTAVIPPQQEDWRRRAQETLLPSLPDAVMNRTLASFLGRWMTMDEAKRHREELMKDRQSGGGNGRHFDYLLSFCEH